MFKSIGKAILAVSALAMSSAASASLITNGSFEQLVFPDKSEARGAIFSTKLNSYQSKSRAWDVFFTLPGWETISGNGMELQKNVVTRSQDGLHHLELDSHKRASNTVITQTLDSLTIDADYLLEFYYKPRTNQENDNGINVFWYDTATNFDENMQSSFVADGTRKTTPNWILQSVLLTANAKSMDLSFGAFGRENSLGGLIDNVSLVQVSKVPEPPTIALAFLALTMLFARRRKNSL